MRKGWNGNFEAGYGNDDHYRAKGMANRFKNKMNLSIMVPPTTMGLIPIKE